MAFWFWKQSCCLGGKGISIFVGDKIGRGNYRRFRLPRDAEQNADASEHRQQVRAAVADERQRQTFVRQRAGDDADVDRGLQTDEQRDANREQSAEGVAGMERDVNAAERDDDEGKNNQQRGEQTQFFADDGKNKIGVMFWNPAEFLASVAEAKAGPAAGAERDHRLIRSEE